MQDTEQTSTLSKCDREGHASKIVKTEHYLEDGDVKERTLLWGCTRCDATSEDKWLDVVAESTDHTKCGGPDNCFGCKIRTLELNAGDAKHSITESGTTQKKWDKELAFYKEARAQGVQPEGTSRQAVQKALEASEVLNKPYDGGKMPKASHVNEKTVEVLKEVGAV